MKGSEVQTSDSERVEDRLTRPAREKPFPPSQRHSLREGRIDKTIEKRGVGKGL